MHYLEACLPLLLLTVLGLKKIQDWLGKLTDSRLKLLPAALVAALLLSNVTGYLPVRLRALARIAESINLPTEAVESLGVHNAVIFTARPFASRCTSYPTMHFVHWRPNNDPDLSNDILWVNHISLETDRRLMEHFPSRTGYVMAWQKGCRLAMRKLDHLEPGSVPDGPVSGTGEEP